MPGAGPIGAQTAGLAARPFPPRHGGRSISPAKAGEPTIHAWRCGSERRRGWWASARHDGIATARPGSGSQAAEAGPGGACSGPDDADLCVPLRALCVSMRWLWRRGRWPVGNLRAAPICAAAPHFNTERGAEFAEKGSGRPAIAVWRYGRRYRFTRDLTASTGGPSVMPIRRGPRMQTERAWR